MSEDLFLEDLGGCGLFQIVLVVILAIGGISSPFTMMFMAYGNYNPGWRCLDDVNSTNTNVTHLEINETSPIWHTLGHCSEFESCKNIQFNPDSSTLVSEWHLLCDKVWIPSLIISIQMCGVLVGAYASGYVSDKVGRKLTFSIAILVNAILNFLTFFTDSWQIFAVFRFLLGVTHNSIVLTPYVLASEFSTWKWRGFISGFPTYGIGGTLFALTVMSLRDWRQIQIATSILTFVLLFPTLWAPESIRWLTLKGKTEKVEDVAMKIARVNRKPLPDKDYVDNVMKTIHQKTDFSYEYSWKYLWKGKTLKFTLIFTPLWFVISLTYFTLGFGIKSLSGNFYINLVISFATEIPNFLLAAYTPNLLGRKKAVLCHAFLNTTFLVLVVIFDRLASSEVRSLAILILVTSTKVTLSSQWYIYVLLQSELYPTVIRSTSLGYGIAIARLGGMTAPYLIPNDADTYFISFTIMAALTFLCSLLVLLLPETKGLQLKDKWEDVVASEPTDTHIKLEPLAT